MRGARGARVLTPAVRSALGSRFSAHCRGFASGASLGRALPVSSPRFEPLDADKSGNWGNNQRGLGHNNYLAKILNARVYEAADETPLQRAPALSAKTRNHVHLKREDLQPVRSFKIRGAYNKVAQLSHEQRSCGIVACSAGNHAQGVAFSAIKLGIDAVIVMPTGTPSIKVDGVRKLGGRVVLHGDTYDEAAAEAARLVEVEGRTLIHPFDDPLVIAGQGTIGMEILKQCTGKPLHAIFVCCGGGGMLAGVAAYVKRVIGVEAEDAAGMTASLRSGQLQERELEHVGLFADGASSLDATRRPDLLCAAVKRVGEETFRICNHLDGSIDTQSTDPNSGRSILEPAGALAIAGVKQWAAAANTRDQTYVAITSGANMNFDSLRFVSERADASETLLSAPSGSSSAVSSHATHAGPGADAAHIYISFQAAGAEDNASVIAALRADGCETLDLTANELAKDHARHLAGGRVTIEHERLYRFEFPERPGALSRFLDALNGGWNVSLFHYRNHGGDVGRVLAALQVPEADSDAFDTFLTELEYPYVRECGNVAYKRFLQAS
ncbi:putative threonine/serine dehydratase [Emiliania huxleyi CCMP1516]|uniref:threonine ammonia-lyase n=2 Tax=Emiliania huxleyi TaxID=2903 RepID=A0A0D3IH90_EMIH1|nr:putative threonine/serine dehydratase [Emiliania huxleyi CCMP1516]EOD10625.1 putative threonine/serine dehydratase [Emiliania huxleyi CCMP1516]|eukprot:XP_005763054.1 putative threonine/serine dehydratase [Emiliania huxleyi CCMP1516]